MSERNNANLVFVENPWTLNMAFQITSVIWDAPLQAFTHSSRQNNHGTACRAIILWLDMTDHHITWNSFTVCNRNMPSQPPLLNIPASVLFTLFSFKSTKRPLMFNAQGLMSTQTDQLNTTDSCGRCSSRLRNTPELDLSSAQVVFGCPLLHAFRFINRLAS